jgi:hypothetical protein
LSLCRGNLIIAGRGPFVETVPALTGIKFIPAVARIPLVRQNVVGSVVVNVLGRGIVKFNSDNSLSSSFSNHSSGVYLVMPPNGKIGKMTTIR